MRVLISADMEGVSGVVHPDDVEPGTAAWDEFRHVMTADVNAAAAGFFEAGATAVVVNDSHYTMRNLVVPELDPRVSSIRGAQKPLGMLQGLLASDGSPAVDALAFVGYHAGAGQPGVLAHTHLGNSIVEVRLAGEPTSEGRMNALVAAEAGVPLVLVTGDDVTCADARRYSPGVSTAEVKRAITRYAAEVLPLPVAHQAIRSAATAALDPLPVPGVLHGPHRIEVDLDAAHLAVSAARLPGVEAVGHRTVALEAPTMLAAYQLFRLVAVMVDAATVGDWG
jgi:D-amino peptidase